ncbi:hypothetical protein [Undibacterium sp. TS12]|uniref:hypothetical protein n=1 Tax=Undibacterium sp. TS12 TaxID=2908202 RepID=UPI001F4C5D27|nr:hypothetical protein [Undibacterium sp. TS12]MCH8620486.1 hypothetical protein [Undibacterium sp. TS12]
MKKISELFQPGADWQLDKEDGNIACYRHPNGDMLSINFFALVPDIDASLDDLSALRNYYRKMSEAGGAGFIELDTLRICEIAAIRSIIKVRMQPSGLAFIGAITLPFSDRSYVIKFQSLEGNPTGMRETVVMANGDFHFDEETGKMKNWMRDPYDPVHEADFMRNAADDESHDSLFPDHPLSRVRFYLRDIQQTLTVASEMQTLPAFIYRQAESLKKPWWKIFS